MVYVPAVLELALCLQEKLAVAQNNRNSSLEERRIKANLVLQRSLEVSFASPACLRLDSEVLQLRASLVCRLLGD